MRNQPLVSVIIPTLNSEKTLTKCLESIRNQTYRNNEIVVVDKFSSDKTIEIAKRYNCRVFVVKAKERSEQRNIGAKNAKGEFVFFIDSDMELTTRVIKECVECFEKNNRISGIIVPEKTIGNNFWGRVREFERSFYTGLDDIEATRFFIKKDFFDSGMYDEDLTGQEDLELPLRMKKLGYTVNDRIRAIICHNEEEFSLLGHLRKKYYYALTFKRYLRKHPDAAFVQINPIHRFGLFIKERRFYSKPVLAVTVIILKILEYLSAGLGVLVSIS